MKRAFAWLTAIALAMPQISTAEGSNMTQDQQEVLAAIEAMTSAFQSKDITKVMESYEPGATVVFEPDAPVDDAAQLQQMFAAVSEINPEFRYENGHEVIVAGDVALHIAPWEMSAKAPDGQNIEQSGLSVALLRKQSDGSWKMVIDNPYGGRLLSTQD